MKLLIACLLIYNFQMPEWWYAVAGVVWIAHHWPLWGWVFNQ